MQILSEEFCDLIHSDNHVVFVGRQKYLNDLEHLIFNAIQDNPKITFYLYPEHREHPSDLKNITEKIKNYSKSIVFTNSPFLVDHFEYSEIFCISENGIKKISDHIDYNKWKSLMRPGEFWSFVGDNWENWK